MVLEIFKKPGFSKGADGVIRRRNPYRKIGKVRVYEESLEKYLRCLDPIFEKAQENSDMQFILTLLAFRGISGPGEDPYENSTQTFDAIMRGLNRMPDKARANIPLWLYAQIVESDEPYEIIANLLNVCASGYYRPFNFPKIKAGKAYRPQTITEKIRGLEGLAKKAGMPDAVFPIKDVFNRDFRNAIAHSSYSTSGGEVNTIDPMRIYSADKVSAFINKACAYHEVLKNLIDSYKKSYDSPQLIDASSLTQTPGSQAQVIIRKGHGVVAIREAGSKRSGYFVGKYYPHESKYIDRGDVLLPNNKVEFLNSVLHRLPNFLARPCVKLISRFL